MEIILQVSTNEEHHKKRKCRRGAQRRKRLKEMELESRLFKFLKTGNNGSEQISAEHDPYKNCRQDFTNLFFFLTHFNAIEIKRSL